MGTTRIYFVAGVLLFVLNGACLVKGTTPATMTISYSTSDDSSTTGMNNGATIATMPADSDIGITCLVCQGGNSSNCNHASPTIDMEDIIGQSGCLSCRILISYTGNGTNITQIERKCNEEESCPTHLMDKDDFTCLENNNGYQSTCEWCCEDDNCNNVNRNDRNSANTLVAAVVLGGWTITKVVYVVVSAVAVAISMSIVV